MDMTLLADVFWFIITFSILVVLHEGGHFLVARAFGVHVHEFMIGLPGPSLRIHGKKTDYGVTAVPLGGYVRISGMEPGPEDERLGAVLAYVTRRQTVHADEVAKDLGIDVNDVDALLITLADWNAIGRVEHEDDVFEAKHPVELADDPTALLDLARSTTYRGLPVWKRILVLCAGVVVNLVSALVVFVLVLTLVGPPGAETNTVGMLVSDGGAAQAGIKVGETITAIDGKATKDWTGLVAAVSSHKPGDKVDVTLTKDGSTRGVVVTLHGVGNVAKIGVQGTAPNVPMSLSAALKMSVGFIGQVFVAIGGFFNPHTFRSSVQQSTGVVGIAVMANQAAQRGPVDFAAFIAVLSLSLGAMNILPIPPLDGGKILIEIIEAVRRKPLSRTFSLGVSLAGVAVLVSLIGYLMYADILRVMNGG